MKRFYKNRRFFKARNNQVFTNFRDTGVSLNAGGASSIGQNHPTLHNPRALGHPRISNIYVRLKRRGYVG